MSPSGMFIKISSNTNTIKVCWKRSSILNHFPRR